MRVLALVFPLLALTACLNRRTTEKIDPHAVSCVSPPPELMPASLTAKVDAVIPKVVDVLNANLSADMKATRIRESMKGLQAFEVIEYRMCRAVAQSMLSKTTYREFYESVIPALAREMGAPSTSLTAQAIDSITGYRAGFAVGRIRRALENYKSANAQYPDSLGTLDVAEYITTVGAAQLEYKRDATQGYVLRFAGKDGALGTADDMIEHGTP